MYKIIIQDFIDLAEMNTIQSPEEKSEEEIYNDDIIPFATSDENHKEELEKQSEIEEQQAPEEKSEKEIYNVPSL
ncbi:hypothetical protein RhiirA5_409554 [Rhizophagus irregularis]|uniref:Uncharacterized protein n=1 Tax=Rhizophagus irregularis TaxID=588596 RepID=A0A2I1E8T5_9GLOM|nr:hypothetical protein RhiirA5_409554 [Rhizophagus irregularis]PKY18503.1 hypothetical protein RhiirB3_431324 [Rhizophagus irregularis]GET53818.1 hypothetical protein RIR_e5689_A0A2N0S2C0_9GLOM [Rhizophagus irregularis DAOM 181602=DAOM 197198]CAG8698817.1 19409_t:CDS:2 [Rhizophagus irregularis]